MWCTPDYAVVDDAAMKLLVVRGWDGLICVESPLATKITFGDINSVARLYISPHLSVALIFQQSLSLLFINHAPQPCLQLRVLP